MSRPLHGFMDVVHEMKRIQDRMYGEGGGPEYEQKPRTYADAWTPTTEVLSKGGDLIIRAELAGVRPEDIDITFTGGTLTISGQRERVAGETEEDEGASHYVQERYYGYFRRSMALPETVSDDDISASFQDGVVEITIAGGATTPPEPKRIQLKRMG
ncbi:MAG: Hsp20/alpha crystallin family protein [Rubrobacteraceae bacterium]